VKGIVTVEFSGTSLVLATVARSLASDGRFRVVTSDVGAPAPVAAGEPASARVLVTDLAVVALPTLLDLVRGRRDLLVIGLDPAGGALVAAFGEEARALGTEDLVGLIEREVDMLDGLHERARRPSPAPRRTATEARL
jgi:hypothetical protein